MIKKQTVLNAKVKSLSLQNKKSLKMQKAIIKSIFLYAIIFGHFQKQELCVQCI